MYLSRKIDKWLNDWKTKEDKSPALIVGIRQCGKTRSIEHFGKHNYKNVVKVNFWDNPEYCSDFDGKLDVNTLISNLSLRFPAIKIVPGDTLLFFDEIQECPRARLAFKNFELDGRYDVIGSGSYLGINGYITGDETPAPTGYEDVFHMCTMDFEEFLWANEFSVDQISLLKEYFVKRREVPEPMHSIFKEKFLNYLCVGGFPKAVHSYVKSQNIMDAVRITQNTVFDMKTDFGRRKGKDGKPVFKASEVSRIQNAFDLIPMFLAKENKRYITSKITGGNSRDKSDAIEYLVQAHIVNKVYNVETPSLPLAGNKKASQFKLFPEDIGIVTAMFGIDTIIAINKGQLGQGKGALYEALVFDSLHKAGIDTYYFAKESGLEIDFVICYDANSCLVEAKAKTGNTKSSKTVMKHPEHYGPTKLIKVGDYNIGETGDILTLPHYAVFMLGYRTVISR
ncbi:MAG: ATP-binding protein [Solobacterium sp.]|nr:ATP-binding protein [Solobacterium sp.]